MPLFKPMSRSLIVPCLLALLACTSERTPNPLNFSNAINAHLHTQELCFTDPSFRFPQTVSAKDKDGQALIVKYDALHEAGLISRSNSVKKIEGKSIDLNMEKALRYELSGPGYQFSSKKGASKRNRALEFCYARSHAAAIVTHTPPQTTSGKTHTEVVYHYSLTQVADWARSQKLLEVFPSVKQKMATLEKPEEHKARLVLTDKRWVYEPQ